MIIIQFYATLWLLSLSAATGFYSSESNRAVSGSYATRIQSIPRAVKMTSQEAARSIRNRRSLGAPLVDSALLRFVSEQKKQQKEQLNDVERRKRNTPFPFPQERTDSSSSTVDAPISALEDREPLTSIRISENVVDPWMGQYNRNRIAQKLISLGADETQALKAGEKVQSYVLARTARRRIRLFLRERDSLWNQAGSEVASSSQRIEKKILGTQPNHPEYGFDDVVDVLLEFGLTGKDICTILTHSPSLALMMPRNDVIDDSSLAVDDGETAIGPSLGETLEQTLRRSFSDLLLTTLGLRKYDARKVLRSCPGLLSVRGSKSAVQVVSMMTKLGVSTSSIARDKTALPALLSRSPAGLFRLVSFLCSDAVRIPVKSIGPLLRKAQSKDVLDAVVPVLRLQEESEDSELMEEDGIDPNVESALWGKTREERTQKINDVYRNMTETISTLRNEIGTRDLSKVVAAFPSVLLLDAEKQILPMATYLFDELGIVDDDLPSVLQQYPFLLGEDIDGMRNITSYLVSLGVAEEDLGRIFRAFPALLTMDIEKDMKPVVEYLHSIGVVKIGRFVTRLPPVLGYSVESELRPKWEFLKKSCIHADFEINKFPAYFSYPLDRVIKTRYDYLAAKGIARQLVPVDAVLRFGDVEFATRIARDEDGGKVFRTFSKKRAESQRGGKQRKKPRPTKAAHVKPL